MSEQRNYNGVVTIYTINKETKVYPYVPDYYEYYRTMHPSMDPVSRECVIGETQEFKDEKVSWPIREICNNTRDKLSREVYTESSYLVLQPEILEIVSILDEGEKNEWQSKIQQNETEINNLREKLFKNKVLLHEHQDRLVDWNKKWWITRLLLTLFGYKP